ncbi:hypothetical protein [Streptomyces sp. NPDC047928]
MMWIFAVLYLASAVLTLLLKLPDGYSTGHRPATRARNNAPEA